MRRRQPLFDDILRGPLGAGSARLRGRVNLRHQISDVMRGLERSGHVILIRHHPACQAIQIRLVHICVDELDTRRQLVGEEVAVRSLLLEFRSIRPADFLAKTTSEFAADKTAGAAESHKEDWLVQVKCHLESFSRFDRSQPGIGFLLGRGRRYLAGRLRLALCLSWPWYLRPG